MLEEKNTHMSSGKKITFCYMCGEEELLSATNSKEHIILESLGSPLWSYDILCSDHNSEFGNTIDSELFAQLGHFADMLGVNLNTKKKILTGYDVNNEEFVASSGLKGGNAISMKLKNGKVLRVTGLTEEETKRKAKKVVKNLIKDKDALQEHYEIIDNCLFKEEYPVDKKIWFKNYLTEDPKLQLFRLNAKMIKSFLKTALNFYFYNKANPIYVEDIIALLKTPLKDIRPTPKVVRMVAPNRMNRLTNEVEISHTLILVGDSESKYLICYIELFCFFRILVSLNLAYDGPDISKAWGYNLIDKATFNPEYEIKFSKHDLMDMQFNEDNMSPYLSESYDRMILEINKQNSP